MTSKHLPGSTSTLFHYLTAIVETKMLNSKIPPPTTDPTTPDRAEQLRSVHAHNLIPYDGYRKENQETAITAGGFRAAPKVDVGLASTHC